MLEKGIRNPEYGADKFGFTDLQAINWNLLEPELYECALTSGEAQRTSGGALCAETGVHTGRSPKDKYIVCDDMTKETVWWENNGKMTPAQFARLYQDFIAHSHGKTLYARDLRAGADAEFGVRTRVFTQFAWHSLFIRALLLRPNRSELATFVPELTIYCCPTFKADPKRHGVRSDTVIAIDFTKKIVLIGGSSYAEEIKKAVFTTMNYFLSAQAVMPMHCSAALNGTLNDGEFYIDKHFGFQVPVAVKGVDSRILKPRGTWCDKDAFDIAARKLVQMFQDNFAKFESVVQADVMAVAMSA